MGKVVLNLTAGPEDLERATIAFLVCTAGQAAGNDVLAFLTMEAVRLGFPGGPESVPQQDGRPSGRALVAVRRSRRGRLPVPVLRVEQRARRRAPAQRHDRRGDANVGLDR